MGKRINNIFNDSKPEKNFKLKFKNLEDWNLFNEKFKKAMITGESFHSSEAKSIEETLKFNEQNYPVSNGETEIEDIIIKPYLSHFKVCLENGESLIGLETKENYIEFNINDIVFLNFYHFNNSIKCNFNINLKNLNSTQIGLKSFENSLYLFKLLFTKNNLRDNPDLLSFFSFLNNNFLFFYLLDKVENKLEQKLLPKKITFDEISDNFNFLLEIYIYLYLQKPVKFNNINSIDIGFDQPFNEEDLISKKNNKIKLIYSDNRKYKILDKELNLFFCNILFNAKIKTKNETSIILDGKNTQDFYLSSCAYLNSIEQDKEMKKLIKNNNNEDKEFKNAKTLKEYYNLFESQHGIKLNKREK